MEEDFTNSHNRENSISNVQTSTNSENIHTIDIPSEDTNTTSSSLYNEHISSRLSALFTIRELLAGHLRNTNQQGFRELSSSLPTTSIFHEGPIRSNDGILDVRNILGRVSRSPRRSRPSSFASTEETRNENSHEEVEEEVFLEASNNNIEGHLSPGESEEEQSNQDENPSFDASVNLQLFFRWLQRNMVFLLLLSFLLLTRHISGLLIFLWLFSLLYNVRETLKQQLLLKENFQPHVLLFSSGLLALHVVFIYTTVCRNQSLWRSFLLISSPLISADQLTIWSVLWIILINDLAVQFVTISILCLLVLLSSKRLSEKRRREVYDLIEMISNLYRSLLPISVWFTYFMYSESDFSFFLACVLTGLYISFKTTAFIEHTRYFFIALKAYYNRELSYGKYATQQELSEYGEDSCSICRDKMTIPVVLPCSHFFCQECIETWFTNERSCPICRTVVHSIAGKRFSTNMVTLF